MSSNDGEGGSTEITELIQRQDVEQCFWGRYLWLNIMTAAETGLIPMFPAGIHCVAADHLCVCVRMCGWLGGIGGIHVCVCVCVW